MRKINYNQLFRQFNPALAVLVAVILLAPIASYAAALVPCGTGGTPCTLCDLVKLANNLIDFMLVQLAAPLATLSIIIGGILMITAGGNESQLQRGKQIFSAALIGFVIALGAWLIIDLILQQLLDPGPFTNPLSGPVC